MTNSSDVKNALNDIKNISNGINKVFSNLNTSWQGKSKQSITKQTQTKLTEIFSKISSQLGQLSAAVELAKEYKELKEKLKELEKELEAAKAQYNSLLGNEDTVFQAQAALQKINMLESLINITKKKILNLKMKIENILGLITGDKKFAFNSFESGGLVTINKEKASKSSSSTKKEESYEKPLPASPAPTATAQAEVAAGEKIVNKAEEIHDYMENNNYTYCVYGGNSYEECGTGIDSEGHGLNSTFEKSKNGYHNTCCATYVSWVLQETGYITEEEHNKYNFNGANNLARELEKKGWERVNIAELEPGDVMVKNHHVQIYGGDGIVYNAGSGSSIRNEPSSKTVQMSYGLRAPKE